MSENDVPGNADSGGSDRAALLNGRYQLDERIGAGGMGEVWRATDVVLNRAVAVKLLHASQVAEPTSRERFRTEARITAVLSHPGIAQVYDYGEQDDNAFLIMELVPGEPLSSILRRNEGLEPSVTLDILSQAAQALGAAHARHVVHRDIKPANLLVTEDGTVKLTDFGIARGNESTTLTQTGMVMGTAQYISPEQASGTPATHASDIYSLGVVAYECLAGTPPFTGDTPIALALAHIREDPPPLPGNVPAGVRELVEWMMRKDPEDRPEAAVDIARHVQRLQSTLSATTGEATTAMALGASDQTLVVRTDEIGHAAPAATSPEAASPAHTNAQTGRTAPSRPDTRRSAASPDRSPPNRTLRRGTMVFAVVAVVFVALGAVLLGQLWPSERGGEGRTTSNETRPTAVESPSTQDNENEDEVEAEAPEGPEVDPPTEPAYPQESSASPTPSEPMTEPTTSTTQEPPTESSPPDQGGGEEDGTSSGEESEPPEDTEDTPDEDSDSTDPPAD